MMNKQELGNAGEIERMPEAAELDCTRTGTEATEFLRGPDEFRSWGTQQAAA